MATKKEKATALINAYDATFSAKSTMALVAKSDLKALAADAEEQGFCLVPSKKSKGEFSLYDKAKKTRYASITAMSDSHKPEKKAKKTSKKAKKTKGEKAGRAPKAYKVKYETKDGKKGENDSLTSCAEIKVFIKDLKKVGLVELRIYNKETSEPTRRSAWVKKDKKAE